MANSKSIICLGWGSLIWDQRNLKLREEERPWRRDGPRLPVDFARQSYDGRMTLVIVPNGPSVQVLWAEMEMSDIVAARANLTEREWKGAEPKTVTGFWSASEVEPSLASEDIGSWARTKGFACVIWTKLQAKFERQDRVPNVDELLTYLQTLSGHKATLAEEYVRRAPSQIRTPNRDAIERSLSWNYDGSGTESRIEH
jgi:hypothetical protein